MRTLQTHDIFMALKVINAAQIRDEVKRIALLVDTDKKVSIKEVGVEFILGCIEKVSGSKSEKAIYEFLSGPLEMEPSEISEMDPFDLMDKLEEVIDMIGKDKLKSFFNRVADLMAKVQS